MSKTLDELIVQSPVFSKSFTGFMLYDPANQSTLYQQNAEQYFTPASNTKIFTLYTALQFLQDSLPLLNYTIKGDSLFFWGTGNPAFLHHDIPQNQVVFSFLKAHQGPLFFSDHNFQEEYYGPGWAWDDYNYAYQVDKSPFPIYGNIVRFERDEKEQASDEFEVTPSYFKPQLQLNTTFANRSPYFKRAIHNNIFEYNQSALTDSAYIIEKPYRTSTDLVVELLADTLQRKVTAFTLDPANLLQPKTLGAPFPDTLYQRLMKDSDNFIAEQLLLLCADQQLGFIQSDTLIRLAKQTIFKEAPDELLWYDGSGLTRYNMFTPRTVVFVLEKLLAAKSKEWLFSIFPGGGQAGTISNWYGSDDQPYLFAKTGTLRNKHCLSGYLVTRSGRLLLFSFMHNNFPTGSSPLKVEMEKILEWIRKEM